MAVEVDWPSQVITVYQADMVDLGGGVYELDVNQLRLDLKNLEDDPDEGMPWPDTHEHVIPKTLSGTTYSRFFEIINGYTLTISPAGAYQVKCTGANHNLADVYNNVGGPTLLIGNAAGLVDVGSALTAEEHAALIKILANTKLIPGTL